MKKGEKIEVIYKPAKPQSEQETREAERQLESAYNTLFDLLLKNEEEEK